MAGVAFNPDDPLQQRFLAALALGESGGASNAATLGVGGVDLGGSPVDDYGFPIWNGRGNSHAAGIFQFQPSTWDSIAQEYHLDFSKAPDQAGGAWYLAEQADPTLYEDLQDGQFAKIQAALANIWPSVTGNGAAPAGLANNLAGNSDQPFSKLSAGTGLTGFLGSLGILWNDATGNKAGADAIAATNAGGQVGSGQISDAQGLGAITGGVFTQGALIVVGAVIVFVALWMLLSAANRKG